MTAQRINKFRTATLDEVLIRRSEDTAWLIFKDRPFEDTFSHRIGPELGSLTDQQVLDRMNAHVKWCQQVVDSERPLEIADGCAQLEWNEELEYWSAVGGVLRCVVDWEPIGNPRGNVAIRVDDKLLSAEEFLRILATHEGWGMRIEFMHPENLTRRPKPLIRKRKQERKQIPYPKFD
jgi:hypothetical protein